MKTIKVKLIGGIWYADYEGDAHIQDLFGTTLIPTPFRDGPDGFTAKEVAEEISKNNPDCCVLLP